MRCLVAGASGLVGGHLVKLLNGDSRVVEITSVGRRSLGLQSERVKEISLNWDDESAFRLPSADVAFCCLGTTIKKAGSQEAFKKVDHDYILRFARASLAAGVKNFLIVSALGASAQSIFFYNKVKGQTEDNLRSLGFQSLVIFRPSLLLGERSEKRAGEALAIQLFPYYKKLLVGPLAKQMPIEAERVAQAMHDRAFRPAAGALIISNHEML